MSNEIKVILSDVNEINVKAERGVDGAQGIPGGNITNASQLPFTPTGSLSSTNVQTALAELDSEKATKLFATNLVTNGDFSNGTTGWSAVNGSMIESGGVGIFTATAQNGHSRTININRTINNLYYIRASIKSTSNLVGFQSFGSPLATPRHSGSGLFENLSTILIASSTTPNWNIGVADTRASGWNAIEYDNLFCINLTALFGAGNEPTKEQMDWIFTERDRLGLGHLNGTQELLPMVSLLNLINKKADIAQEAWITPTLLNGWAVESGKICRYRKNQLGQIEIELNITGGTLGANIMTLPIGYRPQFSTFLIGYQSGGTVVSFEIGTGGTIVPITSNPANNSRFKTVFTI